MKTTSCKHCGKGALVWLRDGERWRLVNYRTGEVHDCRPPVHTTKPDNVKHQAKQTRTHAEWTEHNRHERLQAWDEYCKMRYDGYANPFSRP